MQLLFCLCQIFPVLPAKLWLDYNVARFYLAFLGSFRENFDLSVMFMEIDQNSELEIWNPL
jgi:hypothetical protein